VAEALLSRGLVPRTFPAGHVLAGCLRLTVRDPDENDRLINAANEIAADAASTASTTATADADPGAAPTSTTAATDSPA
jgi:hypothetical protein